MADFDKQGKRNSPIYQHSEITRENLLHFFLFRQIVQFHFRFHQRIEKYKRNTDNQSRAHISQKQVKKHKQYQTTDDPTQCFHFTSKSSYVWLGVSDDKICLLCEKRRQKEQNQIFNNLTRLKNRETGQC